MMSLLRHPFAASSPRMACLAGLLAVGLVFPAAAQFRIHSQTGFEEGALPEGTRLIGPMADRAVSVVDVSAFPDPMPVVRDVAAARATGRYVLGIAALPNAWISGLVFEEPLRRGGLAESAMAMVQADFHLPEPGQTLPNVALLAAAPLEGGGRTLGTYYRFGIALNNTLYFSKIEGRTGAAAVYLNDRAFLSELARPGWHRFSMVFEGPNRIRCFINGNEVPFSPIEEAGLRTVQVGVALAEQKERYSAYVDNVSLQWSPTPELPGPSPYGTTRVEGPDFFSTTTPSSVASAPGVSSSPPVPSAASAPVAPGGSHGEGAVEWLDTETGWERSRTRATPMLVLFHSPRVSAAVALDALIQREPAARQYIANFVPIRIDITQTAGREAARKFNVYRTPTILLLEPDGTERARTIVQGNETWPEIVRPLSPRVAPIY